MAEEKVAEKSRFKIKAPSNARYSFFQRLSEAAQAYGLAQDRYVWFPKIYTGAEESKVMTEFPVNDAKLKDLVAALDARHDYFQTQADQATADRDEILRQAEAQGYVDTDKQ
jgi:hypothetical protein